MRSRGRTLRRNEGGKEYKALALINILFEDLINMKQAHGLWFVSSYSVRH